MLDLEATRSVRRSDLRSPISSAPSTPDPELTALFESRVRERSFDDGKGDLAEKDTSTSNIAAAPPNRVADSIDDAPDSDAVELSFFLFRSPPNTKQPSKPQKIRLRTPSPEANRRPGFIRPERPHKSYYFTGPRDADSLARLAATAVTGADVRSWAAEPLRSSVLAKETRKE
ncbi:hypothetical protein BDY21DRAFT_364495 [Lineolata rhizophorae]|uniref:Uncharacterized protein n=1 Tax=Lineolata rhizophorae TaxID=578093 RepID=A0A6A6NZK2_9PEZI|nr:hypothetical protein BDY21DRAFT_364495 [Lineolata rhizophorae]